MNRAAFMRAAAAFAGALAAVVALALLLVASGKITLGGTMLQDADWVLPLAAGVTVGTLSWLLLADDTGRTSPDADRVTVRCPACGTEVRSDWRLCPYCGGSNDPAPSEANGSTHLG